MLAIAAAIELQSNGHWTRCFEPDVNMLLPVAAKAENRFLGGVMGHVLTFADAGRGMSAGGTGQEGPCHPGGLLLTVSGLYAGV
jgi:hypothetical protein